MYFAHFIAVRVGFIPAYSSAFHICDVVRTKSILVACLIESCFIEICMSLITSMPNEMLPENWLPVQKGPCLSPVPLHCTHLVNSIV